MTYTGHYVVRRACDVVNRNTIYAVIDTHTEELMFLCEHRSMADGQARHLFRRWQATTVNALLTKHIERKYLG